MREQVAANGRRRQYQRAVPKIRRNCFGVDLRTHIAAVPLLDRFCHYMNA